MSRHNSVTHYVLPLFSVALIVSLSAAVAANIAGVTNSNVLLSQEQSDFTVARDIQNRLSFCYNKNSTENTRALYVEKPYPPRGPEEGISGVSMLSDLGAISHFIFGGKPRPNIESDVFRVLVAGCGTGDTLIQLYVALGKSNIRSEVIGLDLSKESLKIAFSRLNAMSKKYSFSSVVGRVIEGQIEHLADAAFRVSNKLELVDYIECGGVLHHLPSPENGLSALFSILKPHGGMGLMVYGKYGRSGVYEAQQLLKLLRMYVLDDEGSEFSLDNWITYAISFLQILPESHPSKRHANYSKLTARTEIADMFLHTCDRPYTVQDIWNFAHSNDKSAFRSWLHPYIYDMNPTYYKIAPQYQRLPLLAKWSFTENFLQSPALHFFYVINRNWRERPPIPTVESYTMSTVLCPWFRGGYPRNDVDGNKRFNNFYLEGMDMNFHVLRRGPEFLSSVADDELSINGFRNVTRGEHLTSRDPLFISVLSKISCLDHYDENVPHLDTIRANNHTRSLRDIYQLLMQQTGAWFQLRYTSEHIFLDSLKSVLKPSESFYLWYVWGGL